MISYRTSVGCGRRPALHCCPSFGADVGIDLLSYGDDISVLEEVLPLTCFTREPSCLWQRFGPGCTRPSTFDDTVVLHKGPSVPAPESLSERRRHVPPRKLAGTRSVQTTLTPGAKSILSFLRPCGDILRSPDGSAKALSPTLFCKGGDGVTSRNRSLGRGVRRRMGLAQRFRCTDDASLRGHRRAVIPSSPVFAR